jgi:hypothetical protein
MFCNNLAPNVGPARAHLYRKKLCFVISGYEGRCTEGFIKLMPKVRHIYKRKKCTVSTENMFEWPSIYIIMCLFPSSDNIVF